MRSKFIVGVSRTSAAALRRRRGTQNCGIGLAALCRRAYGAPSFLRSLALTSTCGSSLLAAAALRTSRRFEASSSQMAAVGARPALSTTPKLRHRRCGQRKRGGSASGEATPPPAPPSTTESVSSAVPGVVEPDVAAGAKAGKRAAKSASTSADAASPLLTTAARKSVGETLGEGVNAGGLDADADAIVMELIASGKSNGLNGHEANTSMTNSASAKAGGSARRVTVEAAASDNRDSYDDNAAAGLGSKNQQRRRRTRSANRLRGSCDGRSRIAEGNDTPAAAGVELEGDTAKAKCTTDDAVKAVGETDNPALAHSASLSEAVQAVEAEETAATAHDASHTADGGAGASADMAPAEGTTSLGRRKRLKRGRRNSSAPLAPVLTELPAEEVHLSAAVKSEAIEEEAASAAAAAPSAAAAAPSPSLPPPDPPQRSARRRSCRGKRGRAPVPVNATTYAPAAEKAKENADEARERAIEHNDAAIADAVAAATAEDAATSKERQRSAAEPPGSDGDYPSGSVSKPRRRRRRSTVAIEDATAQPASIAKSSSLPFLVSAKSAGDEGEAATPSNVDNAEESATPAATAETTTGIASEEATSPSTASTSVKVSKRGKRAATPDNEAEAVMTVELRDDATSAAPKSTTATAAAATCQQKGGETVVASAEGRKRRGRKKNGAARAAASAAEPAAPIFKNTEVNTVSSPASSTGTTDAAAELAAAEADADLPKSTAAALKKLLAAGACGGDGGAPSLEAKKRLAAQIIRRRWQLQQESKRCKAAPTAATAPLDQPQQTAGQLKEEASSGHTPKTDEVNDSSLKTVAAEGAGLSAARGDESPIRKKGQRRNSRRRSAAHAPAVAAEEAEVEAKSEVTAPAVETEAAAGAKASSEQSSTAAGTVEGKEHDIPTEAEEAARDAEVAAAIKAAIALAAMPEVDPLESERVLASVTERLMPSDADVGASSSASTSHKNSSMSDAGADAANGPIGTPRSLSTLVARSQSVCTPVAAKSTKGSSSSSNGSRRGDNAKGSSTGTIGGGSGGNKGVNSKDTLYFPDYRERVVQIFEQMAEINSALGERYKCLSYSNSVERLKRGDKVFQLLPPNLLPLPEDDPKWKAPVHDASTPEPVMAAAQRRAKEVEENRAKRKTVLSAANLLPGLGSKLRLKVVEILKTGDLKELHQLQAKPLICAIRELTQVHGFGPRTAIEFFKTYGITSVKELQDYAVEKGELDMSNKATGKPAGLTTTTGSAHRTGFHLNDAQRLGLVYYRDMSHRIPHDEGRLHEAFMKLRLRKYLGKEYELVVCGSYRRRVETSGDIDVLITRKRTLDGNVQSTSAKHLPSSEVLETFLKGLKADRYIEATLAQGPTKFMGLCRLRALPPPPQGKAGSTTPAPSPPRFRARRLDIRYVDANCFPAAMLYFTGSKNFNVIMRSEAIKKRCILNEYGLFRKFSRKQQLQRQACGAKPYNLHEMITRIARFGFASIEDIMENSGDPAHAAGEEADEGLTGTSVMRAAKKIKKKSKERTREEVAELCAVAKVIERQRVKARTEREIFDALEMDYVQPEDRNV
ncbi:putative mitochondrial DNA polymerase beta-PAK [Leptomonas seymouri]|uniref:Putative mitochondrial DNA polymerase beta-PAK n=1 Tax=Leptomonas seymouri TaxID=5684 RepID=A0A0N0P350_LEPSE|nr:putative mitochondrial DNA polymerase beta-PAK [Leptomonas seymouri]|eukprot:KPI83719.1 putative mitochondrial DNA polymerase beta-PAK [Leptomonas seymouri]